MPLDLSALGRDQFRQPEPAVTFDMFFVDRLVGELATLFGDVRLRLCSVLCDGQSVVLEADIHLCSLPQDVLPAFLQYQVVFCVFVYLLVMKGLQELVRLLEILEDRR